MLNDVTLRDRDRDLKAVGTVAMNLVDRTTKIMQPDVVHWKFGASKILREFISKTSEESLKNLFKVLVTPSTIQLELMNKIARISTTSGTKLEFEATSDEGTQFRPCISPTSILRLKPTLQLVADSRRLTATLGHNSTTCGVAWEEEVESYSVLHSIEQ